MKMALVKVALATGVGLAMLAACGSANDGYDPSIPTAVEYVDGSGQSGNTGDALPAPLTVKVTNLVGDPVPGIEVSWFVVSGGGRISSGTTTSDADGLVQVSWVLGPIVGPQTVQAVSSLSGSPVSFAATARSGPPDGGGGGGEPLIRSR
jgi:hypothetical protein